MQCIAHRGFADVNPENTLQAVREATRAGAHGVEIDVRRCGSGELVVIHDETVDRVTNGSGTVRNIGLSTLRKLDVLATGSGVPTLEGICEAVPPDVRLHVELKETGIATDALTVLDAFDNDVLLSSFEMETLANARDADNCPPLAFLFHSNPEHALMNARELGCRAVNPHWSLCDREFVERAHESDFRVNAWTVDSNETSKRLVQTGVDGLITDAPEYCQFSKAARDRKRFDS